MRVPVAWLRDFVQTAARPEAMADALTSRGFTVDALVPQPTPERIVVGRVETLDRHPNADRLQVAKVNVGTATLQIVTGAENVRAGNKVPVALAGAEVFAGVPASGALAGDAQPKTKTILQSTLRGVRSDGMLCSASELALPGEFEDGIIIMEDDAEVGADFWRAARFGDALLDVDVPSNRPDCLSIVGLARELAAALDAEFKNPQLDAGAGSRPSPIGVEIGDAGVCRRFIGQYFWDLVPRRTALWMRLRLQAAGVRSLNYWVDVSNYVQLETGQPLHFYDAKKLRGAALSARAARDDETIVTLDGAVRALRAGMPVIADEAGPVSIAGVLGGAATAVSDETTELFLESASFVGRRVRRTFVDLGLRTEAGARHEKNLPVELAEYGRRHAARLLIDAGAQPSAVADVGERPAPARSVNVRPARVNLILGTGYDAAAIRAALNSIGFTSRGDEPVMVAVPYWRPDVVEEIDLIEEVARVKGYDAIPERSGVASPQPIDEGLFRQETLAANAALAIGYREIVTVAIQGTKTREAWIRSGIGFWDDVVDIVNPLSEDQRFLRPSLLPGMLQVAARARQRGSGARKLFEIGHVFRAIQPGTPNEPTGRGAYTENGVIEWPSLCGVATFDDADDDSPLDARLRETIGDAVHLIRALSGPVDVEISPKTRSYWHPGAAADLTVEGMTVAKAGRLHPRLVRAFELAPRSYSYALYLERLPLAPPVHAFRALPKFPGIERDIAVIVAEAVAARDLIAVIRGARVQTLESVTAFDEYRGPQVGAGKKSVALSLSLRRPDGTMTDDEADAAVRTIVAALKSEFGIELRGATA